jgi:hypothetical protein
MPPIVSRLLQSLRGLVRPGPVATSLQPPSRQGWTAADWARVRAPERHRDRELSDKAQRWLDRLPAEAVPHTLAERFPRVVNRLAAMWKDVGLIEEALYELQHDTRGTRQGFPAAVMRELRALQELHDARVDVTSASGDQWSMDASR